MKRAFDGRFLLLLVADGAGGHNAGDKAATMVARTLDEVFSSTGNPPEGPPADWLTDVILASHEKVRGLATGENRPPASTLVGLLVEEETLCAWRFHVGDSRLYGQRTDEQVMSWTRDHNITNGLIDRGLPVAQALKIAEGGKLTQVMGGGASPEPEIRGPFQLAAGDSFLICSDGVYGYNRDPDPIPPSLDGKNGDAVERAQTLKAAVLAGDALDNLTAVIWSVPADAEPARKRLGLVEPYDRQDVNTMVNLMAHRPGATALGPTGPPPPRSMPKHKAVDRDMSPSAEDLQRAQDRLDAARGGPSSPGLKFGMMLMAALALLAFFVWARSGDDVNAPMSMEDLERDRAQARAIAGMPAPPETTPEPTPEPVTEPNVSGSPVNAPLAQLLAGFEPGWWSGVAPERRTELQMVLRELLAPKGAQAQTLSWEFGDPPQQRTTEVAGWFASGGDNATLAANAWAARGRIMGLHGDLASQPGVAEAMRAAACDQVRLRWTGRPDAPAGDAVQLPSWLAACLPAGSDGASVTVTLGDYPDAGWTNADWNELATLTGSPGGSASITRFDPTWNPRLVELGQLTRALSQSRLADVEVEVKVALDSSDSPEQAASRAEQVASLLRDGSGGVLRVTAIGNNSEPLAEESEPLSQGQASKLADLNRRVEVTLFRSSHLDFDEEEAIEAPGK